MSSLATTSYDALPLMPALRVDDAELSQQIALALRTRRPTLDMDPLLAGRYRIEARISADERVERYDATRVSDGRWVTVEMPIEDAANATNERERFIRSARQQCRLRHPHVMYALEHGVGADGRPYLVREAIDTESLAQVLAREGSVTWTRARSIALQLCAAVTAARELGLAPVDLSLDGCRRARHGRAVDDIRLAEWRELEGMTPDERDERGAVFAIARIVEELVAGYGARGEVGTNPNVVAPPPAELGTVLARGRSLVPSARYASVEQLGLAIAAIGDDVRSSPDGETTYALIVPPRRRSRQIEQPVEIRCTTAEVFLVPEPEIESATESVTMPPRAEPQPRRRILWPWIGLATMVGVCAVHVVVPEFWPGLAARAESGFDALRDLVRGREPLEAPMPSVAIEDVQHGGELEEDPEVAPTIAPVPAPTPAPVVMPVARDVAVRSNAVPPAPAAAPVTKAPAKKVKMKRKPVAATRVVTADSTEPEMIALPVDRTAPIVDAIPASTTTIASAEELPSSPPPLEEPPRALVVPPSIEGESQQ